MPILYETSHSIGLSPLEAYPLREFDFSMPLSLDLHVETHLCDFDEEDVLCSPSFAYASLETRLILDSLKDV